MSEGVSVLCCAVGEAQQLKTDLKVVVERLKTAMQSRSSHSTVSRGLILTVAQ